MYSRLHGFVKRKRNSGTCTNIFVYPKRHSFPYSAPSIIEVIICYLTSGSASASTAGSPQQLMSGNCEFFSVSANCRELRSIFWEENIQPITCIVLVIIVHPVLIIISPSSFTKSYFFQTLPIYDTTVIWFFGWNVIIQSKLLIIKWPPLIKLQIIKIWNYCQ